MTIQAPFNCLLKIQTNADCRNDWESLLGSVTSLQMLMQIPVSNLKVLGSSLGTTALFSVGFVFIFYMKPQMLQIL